MKKIRFLTISVSLFLQGLSNTHAVVGRKVIEYTSPNNLTEKCIPLAPIPGGKYTDSDLNKEEELCAVNFYENTVALCPKEKSTSPGTYVYSLVGLNDLNFHQVEAEKQCAKTDRLAFKVGTFKQTMNQATTSATNSLSSLLYYHFSRYFDTMVKVPVSVYRTMDKDAHHDRVAEKAHGNGSMNIAGWNFIKEAEEHPERYNERLRLFTDNFKQIFGVLLKAKGERYGSYFFGTRESGWKSQYLDFKAAPPFMAVKSSSDLKAAIKEAISTIKKSQKIYSEVGFFSFAHSNGTLDD